MWSHSCFLSQEKSGKIETLTIYSILDRRSLEPSGLESRKSSTHSVLWCAPGTQTYIVLSMVNSDASGNAIRNMLNTASSSIAAFLSEMGDGVISKGGIAWPGVGGVGFLTSNSNNHQTTWGVLHTAVSALNDYMSRYGYGAASFTIADGLNIVGRGYVGIGQGPE